MVIPTVRPCTDSQNLLLYIAVSVLHCFRNLFLTDVSTHRSAFPVECYQDDDRKIPYEQLYLIWSQSIYLISQACIVSGLKGGWLVGSEPCQGFHTKNYIIYFS